MSNVHESVRRRRGRGGAAAWTAVLLGLACLALAPAADAQPAWSWPDDADNLQVLPQDTDARELRSVMSGFIRGLGVRCSHCHVGREGQPLNEWDFASDDKREKRTAREMLRLVATLNRELEAMETVETRRVEVSCHTCHAGRPLPRTLEEELLAAHGEGGADALVARYGELRERYHGRGAYDFGEARLNGVGYRLLGDGDLEAAIAVFRLNARQFPDSGNVWDSLAEGYLAADRPELARIHYEHSLTLDPDNGNALDKLAELRRAAGAGEEE